jgi:hypothetical protein
MPYVSRDDGGSINGLYANLQPGFAEEWLPDDDPEVLAYQESLKPGPPPPDANQRLDDGVAAAQAVMSQPPPVVRGGPSGRAVGQEEFDALNAQVQQLEAAMKAMLEAHAQVQPAPA